MYKRQTILALGTAFFIICQFSFNPGPQIAFPLVQAKSTDNQPNAQAWVEQGRKLYDAGDYSQAVTVLQQAVDAFRASGDRLGEAMAFSNLSLAWKQLGQLEKANDNITQSLKILETEQNRDLASLQVLAQVLDVQGNLQLEVGRTQQALDSWKQAANLYEQIGDEVGKIRSLINLAQAEQSLGLYRQARTNLEQLFISVQKQPDSVMKATALRSLGDVLQLVGELEKSLKVLQQSRDVAERLRSPSQMGAALLSLGNTQRALGNRGRNQHNRVSQEKSRPLQCTIRNTNNPISNEASRYYQQAVQSYQQAADISGSPLVQIQAQINQLNVLLELQQWSEAQKLASEVQYQLSRVPANQTAIFAEINLAQSLICLNQAKITDNPGWKEIAQGLATAIQQANSNGDRRSVAYALGTLAGLYLETQDVDNAQKLTEQALTTAQTIQAGDIAYLWQWQLGHILRIKGDIKGAIAFYEQAVSTLNSLRNDLVALNPDIQFSFRDNVEPVYRQFVDLLLQPSPHLQVSQQNLKQARNVIEALQLTELENFFREACLQPSPKQIDEVVDKTDPTAAVIYPIILEDRLEVILKLPTNNELRHHITYKQASEVETVLEKLQQSLTEPDRINDVKKYSAQVYSWLIQPLETELAKMKIKTLVFVLDGSLRNIPMAVLYNDTQKQYLIQKYAVALAPGLQLIDPKPLQRGKLNVLAAGVSEQRYIEGRNFAPLKNVEVELQKIQSAIPKSEELLNQNFTKTNVKNQIKEAPYTVVHIATHGEFSSNVEKTFILTWEQLLKVKDFDNLLRIHNGSESRTIELLVLSAC
ncbi:MAG: CHAT domain-containing protein, partial [Fischerella sp.]|nr:CHAT domain-containing protein [Fischerella sp.]